jgi:hypothetical protein
LQILRNTPATLELLVYENGDPVDLDANPTIAITDANGAAVTTGSVTKPGATTGEYRSLLPGQADLKDLRVVWSGVLDGDPVSFTQHHDIVGNLLFTEAEARAARFTGQQTPLSDEDVYTDAMIVQKRAEISEMFEERTERSWIRRYCRVELHGNGSQQINLRYNAHPRDVDGSVSGGAGWLNDIASLISVTVNSVALDVADVKIHGANLIRTDGSWSSASWSDPYNIVVEYEYGLDSVPLEARENGLRMVVASLVPSDVPDYAQTLSVGGESYSFQQAAPLGGMLRVWPERTREWLDRNAPHRVPGFA